MSNQYIGETGSSNRMYIGTLVEPTTSTTGELAKATFSQLTVKSCDDGHCGCKDCQGREEIINKIWEEYRLIKDAAKWWREVMMPLREKVVVEYVSPDVDPVLLLLLQYRDRDKNTI